MSVVLLRLLDSTFEYLYFTLLAALPPLMYLLFSVTNLTYNNNTRIYNV